MTNDRPWFERVSVASCFELAVCMVWAFLLVACGSAGNEPRSATGPRQFVEWPTEELLEAADISFIELRSRLGMGGDLTSGEEQAQVEKLIEMLVVLKARGRSEAAIMKGIICLENWTGIDASTAHDNAVSEFTAALAIDAGRESYFFLGRAYLEGAQDSRGYAKGIDYHAARKWFEKALEYDTAAASAQLGEIHEHGLGLPVDLARAEEYYAAAHRGGYVGAAASLSRVKSKRAVE